MIDEVVTVSLEEAVGLNAHVNVKVTGGPAVAADVPFTSEAHLHPIFDASGDSHGDLALPPFRAGAVASGAGGRYHAATALASRAGGHLGELAEDTPLGPAHLAYTTAGGTGVKAGTRLVSCPGATLAALQAVDLHLPLRAEDGLLKGEVDALLKVASPLGLLGPPSGCISKERIEDVAEASEHVETFKRPVEAAIGTNSGLAEAVILGPLVRVG